MEPVSLVYKDLVPCLLSRKLKSKSSDARTISINVQTYLFLVYQLELPENKMADKITISRPLK